MPQSSRSSVAGTLVFLLAALLGAAPASATWSIILVDTRTGEVGVASATCLTTFDLRKWTPVLLTGVGAATAQASVGGTQFAHRTVIRDRMLLGAQPGPIIGGLGAIDPQHASRQYGIVNVQGGRATFAGPLTSQWAGGLTGSFEYTYEGQTGTIVYAIQGNILTGAAVVQNAVAAARDTSGDLPRRLMAAMEAARAAGGDGRCSCTTGGPTSCGAPPPSFTKSAHIGYMMIARAGDMDASHSYFRAGFGVGALVAADLTGDGLPEIACANSGESSASVLRNLTVPTSRFPTFDRHVPYSLGVLPRAVGVADITGDGVLDLVTSESGEGRVSVLPGMGNGAMGAAVATTVGGQPGDLIVADFDGVNGPDVAFIDMVTADVRVMLNDGAGGLLAPVSYTGAAGQSAIIAADVNGDGDLDLVIADGGQPRLRVLHGDDAGGFAPAADIAMGATSQGLAAADFDGDGDVDLAAVQQNTQTLSILLNDGGVFTSATVGLGAVPNHVAVGDVNGDGFVDAVVPVVGGRFLTIHGSASGAFAPAGDFDLTTDFAGNGIARVVLTDVDADGDLDAAFAVSSFSSIAVAENLGGGVFIDGAGTASGDYFMNFNVANQAAGAPDPVFQLQEMFDSWRAPLIGRPDAVQSLVSVPTLVAGSSNTGVMTITLRDWQGDPVTAPISSLTVEPVSGDEPHVTVVSVATIAPGVYEATMAASASIGSTRFAITADDGVRPVALMPAATVIAGGCPADWNIDGEVNSNDISAFLTAWIADVQGGGQATDFNGDMLVNSNDISAFLTRWISGALGMC